MFSVVENRKTIFNTRILDFESRSQFFHDGDNTYCRASRAPFREFAPKHMGLLEYSRFGAWSKCYHHHEKIDQNHRKMKLKIGHCRFVFIQANASGNTNL